MLSKCVSWLQRTEIAVAAKEETSQMHMQLVANLYFFKSLRKFFLQIQMKFRMCLSNVCIAYVRVYSVKREAAMPNSNVNISAHVGTIFKVHSTVTYK